MTIDRIRQNVLHVHYMEDSKEKYKVRRTLRWLGQYKWGHRINWTYIDSDLSPKRWGSSMWTRAWRDIYNTLTQGRTVQKGGFNPQPPGKSHPVHTHRSQMPGLSRPNWWWRLFICLVNMKFSFTIIYSLPYLDYILRSCMSRYTPRLGHTSRAFL